MLTMFLLAAALAQATPMTYLGRPSTFVEDGLAPIADASVADGTIEFDIAMHGHPSFAGIAFRIASADDYELIYLRPHRSRQPDALQYTPIFGGSEAWQLYNGEGYTAAAELPLNRWVHVRLVIAGYTARVFLDRAAEPQLLVTDLKRPWARGGVGLWGRLGGANFANVTVTPLTLPAPAAKPDPVAAATVLTTWDLSPALDTATTRADVPPDAKTAPSPSWLRVVSEASGVVNIARYRRSARTPQTADKGSRDLVFARTEIASIRAQRMRLVFGYSDAIHIFLNGRLWFAGESAFRSRDPSFLGIVSLGPDAIYVDLQAGRNELILAVSEDFGGWGFAARLEPLGRE